MTRPQISANTYVSSGDMRNILGTPAGSSPANALTVPTRRFVDQNVTLMVPLYTGGKLGNLVKAASQRESAVRASIDGAEADAVLMVKEAYYRALLAAEMAKAAEARVTASTALVASTRAQFEAGKGIQASVSRADAELADAGRMLTNARNDRAKMLLDLKRAMGVQLDSDVTLSDVLVIAPPPEDLGASLTEAARSRPELLAARARLDSAKAQAGAARGDYKPQVYGVAMGDAFSPGDMGKRVGGTVGVTVSIPLLDAGQRSAEVRQMEAMRRRSEVELKEMELRVATEVRQARLDIETAAANYGAAQTVLQSFEAAYDVVVLRVESQRAILLEQLDALTALTQARANLAEAVFDHSIAVARLQRAIGRP
jgi:outer membrane protein